MKHSPDQLISLLTQFATDFKEDLSSIEQSGWPNPDITLGMKDHLNDGCSLAARRRYGVQLAMKLISVSHEKVLNQLDQISLQTPEPATTEDIPKKPKFIVNPSSSVYVPDTCAIIKPPAYEDFAIDDEDFDTRVTIPETQLPNNDRCENATAVQPPKKFAFVQPKKNSPTVPRKRHSYDEIMENCFETFAEDVSKVNKSKLAEHVKTKDELIREKYPPLPMQFEIITKVSLNDSTRLFGTGATTAHSGLNRAAAIDVDSESDAAIDESPSVLTRPKRTLAMTDDTDFDDFKPSAMSTMNLSSDNLPRNPSKKSKKSLPPAKMATTNKFGMSVEPVTASQLHKSHHLKQGSLDVFLKNKGNSSGGLKQSRVDHDFNEAIKLSLEDQKEMIKKENNKSFDDDSFDMLSNDDDDENDENDGFKVNSAPVKKAAERKLLKGIDCKQCREYYEGIEMPEEKLKQLLQKCSRHRTKYEPPPSPTNPWNLTLQKDGPEDKTQAGSPLKTRKARRLTKPK